MQVSKYDLMDLKCGEVVEGLTLLNKRVYEPADDDKCGHETLIIGIKEKKYTYTVYYSHDWEWASWDDEPGIVELLEL